MYENVLNDREKSLFDEMVNGYKLMGKVNIEISELGIDEDLKDLLKYEESIMGCGI